MRINGLQYYDGIGSYHWSGFLREKLIDMPPQRARTDRNNNPIACTTDVAHEGGLVLGVDYSQGDPFTVPTAKGPITLYTARFIGDPIALSIRVIDHGTYYTHSGLERWSYMAIPAALWATFSPTQKKLAIAIHYQHESGTEMKGLFA